MKELAITASNCITAVGHDGRMTAAAVRAEITDMVKYDSFSDQRGNPITVSRITGIDDDNTDTALRMANIVGICLNNLLEGHFQKDSQRPSIIHLFLGVSSKERPGPRFETSCRNRLHKVLEERTNNAEIEVIPHGNASMQYAIANAAKLIENDPAALCIIGGIDSLLDETTLHWFDQAGRLKSTSYGRHQGLIAGEAVGFMIIEDQAQTKRSNRQVLARISGLGLAAEPTPRASMLPSRNSGLTNACRAAMAGVQDKDIRAVFCDLNGENSRAREWGMVDIRCFNERHEEREMWHPANCYGDIGAASGVVLANIVSQGFVRNWLESPVLIFCSDDHGSCGAMVLENG